MPEFNSIPLEDRAQWLDYYFGYNHDSIGLTEEDAERITFGALIATLHGLMRLKQGATENGLRRNGNRLEISHPLSIKLYRILRQDPNLPGITELEKAEIADAREFACAWSNAQDFLDAHQDDGNEQGLEMPPPGS